MVMAEEVKLFMAPGKEGKPTGPGIIELIHACKGEMPEEGVKQLYEIYAERRKLYCRCPECGDWRYLGKVPKR